VSFAQLGRTSKPPHTGASNQGTPPSTNQHSNKSPCTLARWEGAHPSHQDAHAKLSHRSGATRSPCTPHPTTGRTFARTSAQHQVQCSIVRLAQGWAHENCASSFSKCALEPAHYSLVRSCNDRMCFQMPPQRMYIYPCSMGVGSPTDLPKHVTTPLMNAF